MSAVEPRETSNPCEPLAPSMAHYLVAGLRVFNPWPNIKVMHTNVAGDVMAGLTVAVIALPLALAFGVASGIGPAAGMWAAVCGGIIVGIFGGSKIGVSGPTGPKVVQFAAILAATRLANGQPDATFLFAMVLLSGLICVALSFCRVGRFIYYVPYSAVSGFMCGIGVIIILLEIPPMLGFATPNSVLDAVRQIPHAIQNENPQAVLVSLSTFATILFWPVISPARWIPGPLMGLLVGTAIAWFGNFKIDFIDAMPVGLPKLHLPPLQLFAKRFGDMIGPACALTGLCVFDSLLTCLVADNMSDDRHDSDREIFGQGLANIACGLLGGVTTATATMRTVANAKCGGQTGLASIVHGVVLMGFMLGLAPLVTHIPMACLAGILLKVGFDIIDHRVLPVLHRLPKSDALCFWLVLILTISVDLLVAMGVGITIAFVRAIYDLGNAYEQNVTDLLQEDATLTKNTDKIAPQVSPRRQIVTLPDTLKDRVMSLELQGPMFFGVSQAMNRVSGQLADFDYLVIGMTKVPMIDLSGAYMLDDIVERATRRGAKVLVTGAQPRVRDTLSRLRVLDRIGTGNSCKTFEQSVERLLQLESRPDDRDLLPQW